mgnify:CR=1 FL=1
MTEILELSFYFFTIFKAFFDQGAKVAVVTAKDKLRTLLGNGLDVTSGRAICFSSEKSAEATIADNGIDNASDWIGREVPSVYSAELSEFIFACGVKLMDEFKQVASDASSNRVATVKLATLIERVADLMEAKLSAKKVVFKLEAADDLTLNTRPGPLSQVLVILIENSLMHGFEREQFSGLIWVVVKTTPKGICIDYRDNGRGIGADVRNSIFQPFFTTKADRGGTGMGLYLAHTMVEGPLCGQMRCEESSAGAHFVIRLPLETTS